jgi:hypothetical protein
MAGGIEADTRHAGPAAASPAAKQGRTYANSVCVRVRVRQARLVVSRQAEKPARQPDFNRHHDYAPSRPSTLAEQ